MELGQAFAHINWLAVIASTLAAFALGGLWYSSLLFGKAWGTQLKLTEEDIKKANMPLIFGSTFVLNLIASIVLALFIGRQGTLVSGLIAGSLVGIAWIATALGTNYLFARKSFKLFLIDASYFITYYAVMGTILGAW